jgi:hypothetical protein
LPSISRGGKLIYNKIEDCEDLRWVFEDSGSSFSLSGVLLNYDWEYGFNRRYSVGMCDELEKFLRKTDLPAKPKIEKIKRRANQRTRLFLLEEIAEIAITLDSIVEGVRYQVCEAIKRSRVSGDRGLLDSDIPMYVSEGFAIKKLLDTTGPSDHIVAYAEARSRGERGLWSVKAPGAMHIDLVNEALTKHMESLSTYRVTADIQNSRPINKKKSRKNAWRGDNKNLMVFLNVEDSDGRILGFQDVGSGMSYVFPIFTSLWASNLSFVEQPELHLHPAAQCELGDVFISAKNKGSFSVIESHSEHLLLRVLRRIRESTLKKQTTKDLLVSTDEVKLYYFYPVKGQGTKVIEIRIDPHGEFLTRWPGGFFSERDRELFDE